MLEYLTEFSSELYTSWLTWLYGFWVFISAQLIILFTKMMIFLIKFSWDVASVILIQLGISELIADSWFSLNSNVLTILTDMKVPDALNITVNAFMTRYVIDFLPFRV